MGYRGGKGSASSGNSHVGMRRRMFRKCKKLEPRVCVWGQTGSRESRGQVTEALKARGRGSALSLGLGELGA